MYYQPGTLLNHSSTPLNGRVMSLARKLELFLGELYAENRNVKSDINYQSIFSDEGLRKSQYIIDDLESKVAQYDLDLSRFALISIGGADGSEIESLLRSGKIKHGLLLERSGSACTRARSRATQLEKEGKSLEVLQGDAIDQIGDAFDIVHSHGLSGIIVSAQAILHELPWRSASYKDQNRFLGKVFREFPATLFYAREPCRPREWPPEVELHVPTIRGDRLHQLMTMVSKHFGQSDAGFQVQPDDYVICESAIAVEVLHKLLRCKTTAEFQYEMGERLTALDADETRQLLITFCTSASNVQTQWLSTDGFQASYAAAKIVARNPLSHKAVLPVPDTHVLFKAIRLARSPDNRGRRSRQHKSVIPTSTHSADSTTKANPALVAHTTSQNLISDCAELSISSTQGSAPSLFDLAPELRFGRAVLEVDGVEIEYGLTEAILELSATGCSSQGERLGDDPSSSFVASEAGGKWRVIGPRDNNGTLSRSPMRGQALCQMAADPNATSQSVRLEVYCHKYHIKYTVMTNIDISPASPTTEAILSVFLNRCLERDGKTIQLSRAEIKWVSNANA